MTTREHIRDEEHRRLQFAATATIKELLPQLQTTLCGLDDEHVAANRSCYGTNKVTHEKKKSLPKCTAPN